MDEKYCHNKTYFFKAFKPMDSEEEFAELEWGVDDSAMPFMIPSANTIYSNLIRKYGNSPELVRGGIKKIAREIQKNVYEAGVRTESLDKTESAIDSGNFLEAIDLLTNTLIAWNGYHRAKTLRELLIDVK